MALPRANAMAVLFLVLAYLPLAGAQMKPYQYFRLGNPADTHAKTEPGFALIGGGKDLDPAFQWLCQRSGGGDFLVLRAHGTDAYNPYIQSLCGLNSVSTLIIPDRKAANDPFVAETIRNAEAVFIAGGDQANYINFWKDTPVQIELNAAIRNGVPIGGTSAGLAVQGEYIYSAQNDPPDGPDLSSPAALANPFHPQIVIVHGFLDDADLADTITDSHFDTRKRMGRLLVFLARIATGRSGHVKGLGIDEQTAVLLEPSGQSKVVGKGAAYFLETNGKASRLQSGVPLSFANISVQKVSSGGMFDLRSWNGAAQPYTLNVTEGILRSTQHGGFAY